MSTEELIEKISQRVAEKVFEKISGSAYKPGSAVVVTRWISQNQASKMIGRKRLEAAKERGLVEWRKKDFDNPRSRVYVKQSDVIKLLKNPF